MIGFTVSALRLVVRLGEQMRKAGARDAYTHRVLERHGLSAEKTPYGEIQRLFTTHLPANPTLFNEYHALLVAVGKTYCRKTPHCGSCPLRYDLPKGSPLLP